MPKTMEMCFFKFGLDRRLGQRSWTATLHGSMDVMMDLNVEVPVPRSSLPKAFNLHALHLILLILKTAPRVAYIEDYPVQNPI